jgi:hypothetical protein
MNYKRTFIIAEAGVNHNGSLELARELIDVAAEAGADAVKFQTFKAEKVVSRYAPKAEYQKKTTKAPTTKTMSENPPTARKAVAIVQSNYIPWKGYFDIINLVDEFILFDDMQYTRRDWRNRNRLKTANGSQWITIPVDVKGRYFQKIKNTEVSNAAWNHKHWDSIRNSYSRARSICKLLGIATKISWSMDYRLAEGKNERLIALCKQAGADEYISGPSAKGYIDEDMFEKEGITLSYMDYSGYPEYTQLYPPFDHAVSIIDLIFNEGPDAQKYMKSF